MKIVTHYSASEHNKAVAVAIAALGEANYNKKRALLQGAVKPLFDQEFSQSECEAIWAAAMAGNRQADGLTFAPNPSNFVQRMNVKTLCWIIAEHAAGAVWPGVWQAVVETGIDAESFTNPEISNSVHDESVAAIRKLHTGEPMTTSTIDIPAKLPSIGDVVDILDALTEGGLTSADATSALGALYPSEGATIAAAENLRAMRGKRPDSVTWAAGSDVDKIIGRVRTPAPVSVSPATSVAAAIPQVDKTTASIIDGVLVKLGLPGINGIIEKANEADVRAQFAVDAERKVKELAEEVEGYKRKALLAPTIGPVSVAAVGDIPAGTVVLKNAADLFGLTDPKKRKLLDFDVPTGEWVDAHGEKAEHPYVPAVMDDFIFNLSTLVPILLSIVSGDKPWLRGHTGTGKTTVVEQVYARLNLPLYRVNLDSDISRAELVGQLQIRQDEKTGATVTRFEEGIIPRSMQEPCGLLLDEIDASRPDLAFVLQRLTEGKGFMLLEDGGRTIAPHPWFRIFATANTNGRGDETGLYTGTRVLGSAFLNRFGPFLVVDYIDQKSEFKLVQMRAPSLDKGLAEQIVGYAKEHRIAFTQGQVTLPCSPRDTVGLAQRMAAYLGIFPTKDEAIKLAFDHVVFNAADNDDVVILKGLADRFISKAAATARTGS